MTIRTEKFIVESILEFTDEFQTDLNFLEYSVN